MHKISFNVLVKLWNAVVIYQPNNMQLMQLIFCVCAQAVENFAWNVRVLKGQADLTRQAKLKSLEDIRQVSVLSGSECVYAI